jgi:hypothetical protein
MIPETSWYATDRQNNAAATATKTADSRQVQVITGIYAAYSEAKTATLAIKEGATTKIAMDVVNSLTLVDLELEFTPGAAVSAVLDASGTAGVYGSVLLNGYTR